ncbi:hypothetical protein PSYCG_04415 [Psychrobacter sp. G]|nr:hypothetical protein PSYCG_04415 [Psychrobacter sp. G]
MKILKLKSAMRFGSETVIAEYHVPLKKRGL